MSLACTVAWQLRYVEHGAREAMHSHACITAPNINPTLNRNSNPNLDLAPTPALLHRANVPHGDAENWRACPQQTGPPYGGCPLQSRTTSMLRASPPQLPARPSRISLKKVPQQFKPCSMQVHTNLAARNWMHQCNNWMHWLAAVIVLLLYYY